MLYSKKYPMSNKECPMSKELLRLSIWNKKKKGLISNASARSSAPLDIDYSLLDIGYFLLYNMRIVSKIKFDGFCFLGCYEKLFYTF